MTGIATFANIDVAAREFDRRQDANFGRSLEGWTDGEEGRNLEEPPDAGDAMNRENISGWRTNVARKGCSGASWG